METERIQDCFLPEEKTCGRPLAPLDTIAGFQVRPGFYMEYGAVAIPGGVSFTMHSHNAASIELLLFRRQEEEPYAVLPFPQKYRIGNVYSMIVFGLMIQDFEYAYRIDGPYEPEKGLIFDKTKYLLDPYARAVTGQSTWGEKPAGGYRYRSRVVVDEFDWGHSVRPWNGTYDYNTRMIGVLFAGRNEEDTADDIVYLAINAYWEPVYAELPKLSGMMKWNIAVNTAEEESVHRETGRPAEGEKLRLEPRSVIVLTAGR